MAELNPGMQLQGEAGFQGYSRGQTPDTSIGGLFQDLGTMVNQGVKAATDIITENVRQDVYGAVDEIRDTTINRLGGPPENASPEEIRNYQRQVEALRASRRAGVLSDSHYWAQLDVETRRIRQKYPGHRHVVDQIVQDVTGANPANRLVAELQQELTARGNREQQQYEYWLKQATELGAPSALNYATLVQQGRPPSLLQLQNETAQIQRQRQTVAFQKSQLELQAAQGQNVSRQATAGANQELYSRAGALFAAGTGAIPRFNELLSEYRRNPPNPAKLQELRTFFDTQVRGPLMSILDETLVAPNIAGGQPWATLITDPNELNAIRNTYTSFVDQLGAAVADGKWSEFTALKNALEAYQRGDTLAAIQGPHGQLFRNIQVAREIYGPQAFQNPEFLRVVPELNQGLQHLFQSGHLSGLTNRTPLAETTQRDFATVPSPQDRANLIGARIRATVGDLANPQLDVKGVEALGSNLFGAGNINFLNTYIVNKPDVYNQIVGDQRVHQNMQRIRDTNPQLYQNYENWVVKGFADSLRSVANDVRDNIQDPNVRANVVFDVRNGRYVYSGNNQSTRQTIDQVNTAINGFSSFLRSQGHNDEQVSIRVAQAVGRLNIDPNAGARTGAWTTIFEQARNFLSQHGHSLGRIGGESTGQPVAGPLSSTGGRPEHYEPLLAEIRRGESGQYGYTQAFDQNQRGIQIPGLTSMTIGEVRQMQRSIVGSQRGRVPAGTESSAIGAYQFVQEALETARDLAGLTDSDKFDQANQDRMAVAILQSPRIGFQRYLQNPTRAEEDRVVNALSGFWAALPNTSGRGTYDGVGINRANRDLNQIRTLVRSLAQQWSNNPVE